MNSPFRLALGALLLSASCCSSQGRVSQVPVSGGNGRATHLRLILGVVDDEEARGLDPPKALRVTLESDMKSVDRVRVEKGLTSRDLVASGVLVLELRTATGPLKYGCLVNAGSGVGDRYLDLGPGESISRVLKLGCYHPPSHERITATATYVDRATKDAPAETEGDTQISLGSDQSCRRPQDGTAVEVFRGPLVSNTVEFMLHAE